MTPTNKSTVKKDPADEDFFLPDFCQVGMVFAVVIIAELLAIVLTLAPMERSTSRWEDLAVISLFIQWVALISAAVLCIARPWLKHLKDRTAAAASYILLLSTTSLVSEVTYVTIRYISSDRVSLDWHLDFWISNLSISAIVSAIVLRYFYIQHQWGRNLKAHAETRIQALQSRIRPHFLFNSLNTIASLTRTQPELAEEATIDLADLFRGTLSESNREHRLEDEWELCRRYLHIEELRMGERLNIDWHIDALPKDALIPQLTLQPLLENAIYHGIEHLPDGGTIRIQGDMLKNIISITITNPVNAHSRNQQHMGNKMAQENVALRLNALHGPRGKLTIDEQNNEYRLNIRIPYIKERAA